jgi:hypothetical protein
MIKLSNLQADGEKIDVDITFIHPFAGLDQFTGFDVSGIVIGSGNIGGFSDPDILVAGEGETRLVNPDGLTRWWNPREFPYNTDVPMWGYINGNKAIPDEVAHYTATLNGYKYFADGLGKDDPLTSLDLSKRGSFSPECSNTRHFTIELDSGQVFNYAIDACWLPPDEKPVIIPDSFPSTANRDEPYLISTQVLENTLHYHDNGGNGGGKLRLAVHCYDWFDADQNMVLAESPNVFDPASSSIPTGGDESYSTYEVELSHPQISSASPITVWVSAQSGMDYDGLLPGKPTAIWAVPLEVPVEVQQGDVEVDPGSEEVLDHEFRAQCNDFDPALVSRGNGDMYLAFFYWELQLNQPDDIWMTLIRFARSEDFGVTFNYVSSQGIGGLGTYDGPFFCRNNKYAVSADGHAFHSFFDPSGVEQYLMLGSEEPFFPHKDSYSLRYLGLDGEPYYGNEILYTSEGYPMLFADENGEITMARGDIPDIAGTGNFPWFEGTKYTLAPPPDNWLSLVRSAGLTSDNRCRLVFWNSGGSDFIRLVSSTDNSATTWTPPVVIWHGLDNTWLGARDPSLWIDSEDGFHTFFSAEDTGGMYHMMHGYSVDGATWNDTSFIDAGQVPVADGLNDTGVVTCYAYDQTYVMICYETAGNVWCRYKKLADAIFSDPIQVNEHSSAALPDLFPTVQKGVVFAYQADDGTGQNLTDIFYRLFKFTID